MSMKTDTWYSYNLSNKYTTIHMRTQSIAMFPLLCYHQFGHVSNIRQPMYKYTCS